MKVCVHDVYSSTLSSDQSPLKNRKTRSRGPRNHRHRHPHIPLPSCCLARCICDVLLLLCDIGFSWHTVVLDSNISLPPSIYHTFWLVRACTFGHGQTLL